MSVALRRDSTGRRVPAGDWAVETHGSTERGGASAAVNDVEVLGPRGCAFG